MVGQSAQTSSQLSVSLSGGQVSPPASLSRCSWAVPDSYRAAWVGTSRPESLPDSLHGSLAMSCSDSPEGSVPWLHPAPSNVPARPPPPTRVRAARARRQARRYPLRRSCAPVRPPRAPYDGRSGPSCPSRTSSKSCPRRLVQTRQLSSPTRPWRPRTLERICSRRLRGTLSVQPSWICPPRVRTPCPTGVQSSSSPIRRP